MREQILPYAHIVSRMRAEARRAMEGARSLPQGPTCETGTVAGLLFLLAHPDDETFIAGGTIAKYAAAGVEIGVICATCGERGKTGDICSRDDLARVRKAEVREAAQILGIRHLEILSYEDQMLAAAPPDEIRRAMVAALRRQRPQIAITFDPNGMNLHPDHIAISRFASDAVAAAADPRWCPETSEPHNGGAHALVRPGPRVQSGRDGEYCRSSRNGFPHRHQPLSR